MAEQRFDPIEPRMLAPDFSVEVAYSGKHIEFKWHGNTRRLVITFPEAIELSKFLEDALPA